MNLYIINHTWRRAIFDIDLYVRELVVACKGCNMNICVVNLMSEKPQIQTDLIGGIKYWYFPSAISVQRTISKEQWELYYRNIVYLLQLYIENKKDLIFHLNFIESCKLTQELQNSFDCRIVASQEEHSNCFGGSKISIIPNGLYDATELLKIYESSLCCEEGKIKVLIVTGQSNHAWQISHVAIRLILENSGLFAVNVAVSPETGKIMSNFKPDFSSYQLVVLDYNGDRWPEETERSFLDFVEKGGGVIIYHAANNAFRDWKEYNRIIGFGGWEDRNETAGPYIYMRDGRLVYDKESPGCAGSHGFQHEFVLNCSNSEHPVTKGLPVAWRHAQDELYDRMRGPGIVKDVLFWGYSDPATKGSGRDEMAIFTVDYGKARIFHTTLGHAGNTLDDNIAMQCTGFQVTLLRGAEWAATGNVTQPVPDDFPTETTISLRKNYK